MQDSDINTQGSIPRYRIKVEKDVCVTMRDGTPMATDVFRPDHEGKFPALLAYGPYGKELTSTRANSSTPGTSKPVMGWTLKRTQWTQFYLRPRGQLLMGPETLDADSVPPDGFYQPPLTVTGAVHSVRYMTPPMLEDLAGGRQWR
jgi:hypothetical protein